MNWLWIAVIIVLWLYLLYEGYKLQQKKVQAVLSNERAVANIAKEMMAGKTQKEVMSYMKKQYKISGIAAISAYAQIKMILDSKRD